jgi:hypothetical protein
MGHRIAGNVVNGKMKDLLNFEAEAPEAYAHFSIPVFRKAIHTSIAFLHEMARSEWPSPASARTWPLSRFELSP